MPSDFPEAPRLAMVSLGCAKNTVDTEIMLGELLSDGFALVIEPGDADLVVVNTCGFIADARDEACAVLSEWLALDGPRVVAVGCWAERDPEALRARFPMLAGVWGFSARGDMARRARAVLASSPKDGTGRSGTPRAEGTAPVYDGPRLTTTPPSYAYLRLSDGCDNRCAYCAIPLIRGSYRERPVDAVLDEARRLADGGVQELVLIAQDTTRYGHGPAPMPPGVRVKARRTSVGVDSLAGLLERLLASTRIPRFRLMYAHPAHLDDATIDLLLNEPRLGAYLDLPLQHIDDGVLARMNRPYGRARVESILARLGADRLRGGARPFTLRTTWLTGFPGETESAFASLRSFVAEGWFTHGGVFAYSPEAGTPAADFDGAVPPEVAEARRRILMETQQPVAFARQDARVGTTETVLLDASDGAGGWLARGDRESPESDGVIRVQTSARHRSGDWLAVRITGRDGYDLTARPLKEKRGGKKPSPGGARGKK